MTALEMLNMLKSTRDSNSCALLWVNHDRRVAALHDGVNGAYDVCYNEAMIARSDPALNIVSTVDGETLAA